MGIGLDGPRKITTAFLGLRFSFLPLHAVFSGDGMVLEVAYILIAMKNVAPRGRSEREREREGELRPQPPSVQGAMHSVKIFVIRRFSNSQYFCNVSC